MLCVNATFCALHSERRRGRVVEKLDIENRIQNFCSIPLPFCEKSNPKILLHSATFFSAFRPLNHRAALKIERKMSDLTIAFDRYASIGTVMHYFWS